VLSLEHREPLQGAKAQKQEKKQKIKQGSQRGNDKKKIKINQPRKKEPSVLFFRPSFALVVACFKLATTQAREANFLSSCLPRFCASPCPEAATKLREGKSCKACFSQSKGTKSAAGGATHFIKSAYA
jgi:hypothetical protein